jgi:uncharacterized membrane protein YjgN (DUF898 family)
MTLESIEYKNNSVVFIGRFRKYIGIILLGTFLSIITLGIYMPWFIRNLIRFFLNNSTYNSENFSFKGTGGKLFVIFLLSIILPIIVASIIMGRYFPVNPNQSWSSQFIFQAVIMIILIPYMYLIYKWMVNVDYKSYNISWRTNFWKSCGKIAVEMILSMITLGIYGPLAMVRLYKYFIDKTEAAGSDRVLRFGYDIDQINDFLFLWGQILLTIISLTIYYPWAFSKIGNRLIGKTYLEKI